MVPQDSDSIMSISGIPHLPIPLSGGRYGVLGYHVGYSTVIDCLKRPESFFASWKLGNKVIILNKRKPKIPVKFFKHYIITHPVCEFADICIISMKTAIKGLFLNFRYRNWLFYIIFLLLGLTVGFYGNSLIQPQGSAFLSDDIQRQRGNFKLVNPILDCSVNTDVKSSKLGQLKEKTQELIDSLKEQNLATHISVYYRDLISRQWFGIDEKVGFTPASLLKVPVMMVYFKKAETDPSIL